MPMIHALLALLISLSGASFDCQKAAPPIEALICGDSLLSSLDDSLGRIWKRVRSSLSPADLALAKKDQIAWLESADDTRKIFHTPVDAKKLSLDSVKTAWVVRIELWNFRMGFADLRDLVDRKKAPDRDMELGVPGKCSVILHVDEPAITIHSSDDLLLRWNPTTRELHFELTEMNSQHQCRSCSLLGEAVRSKTQMADGSIWKWVGKGEESGAQVEFRITRDQVAVEVAVIDESHERYFCGLGANFHEGPVFRKINLRQGK